MSQQGGLFADQKKKKKQRWETPLCKVWNPLEICMRRGMIQSVKLALF